MTSAFRQTATLAIALFAAFIALPAIPESKDPVLPVSKEPSHHIRFDNGRVRVYDVRVPTRKWTEFHEHSWDNFFVFIIPTTQAYEFIDGSHDIVRQNDVCSSHDLGLRAHVRYCSTKSH